MVNIGLIGLFLSLNLLTEKTAWLGLELKLDGSNVAIISKVYQGGPAETKLKPGQIISGIAIPGLKALQLSSYEQIFEPDSLPTFENYDLFFEKQRKLFNYLNSQDITLVLQNGEKIKIHPLKHRPIKSISFSYWLNVTLALSIGVNPIL